MSNDGGGVESSFPFLFRHRFFHLSLHTTGNVYVWQISFFAEPRMFQRFFAAASCRKNRFKRLTQEIRKKMLILENIIYARRKKKSGLNDSISPSFWKQFSKNDIFFQTRFNRPFLHQSTHKAFRIVADIIPVWRIELVLCFSKKKSCFKIIFLKNSTSPSRGGFATASLYPTSVNLFK